MKKCTCMGEDAYICQCHYDMIQKELADWKARAEKAEKELIEAVKPCPHFRLYLVDTKCKLDKLVNPQEGE